MDLRTDTDFFDLLSASFVRLMKHSLVPMGLERSEAANWLYESAPFGILAHNTADDPMFVYGNIAAQRLFEYDWNELVSLPSRLSAEQPARDERQRFLEEVQRNGFVSGYRGIRVSKTGRRFEILDATVWQLIDDNGQYHGQAAMLPQTKRI